MNVDRRWWATSVVRRRVLVAGLALLGTGCAILGLGSRSLHSVATAERLPVVGASMAIPPTPAEMPGLAETRVTDARARSLFAGLPLIFEPNQGQAGLDPSDSRAKFVTRGSGYSLFLGSQGAILSMVSHDNAKPNSKKHKASAARVDSLEMKLAGANPNAVVSGAEALPGKSNYFTGNDQEKWRTGVPQFARVRYDNIYPGINLVFYGNQGQLEYDFQVAPGSDPSQAELEFHGAKRIELSQGALVIKSERGSVQLAPPRVYQEIAGRQQPVEGSFVLRGNNRAGFAIGSYDRSRELIIDPILTFSTYFGGSGDEHATQVAVDGSFNIYLAGSTTSPNLPAVNVYQTSLAGSGPNVYIAKITQPSGSLIATLDFVTYLGGNGMDYPVGIKVDGRGDSFVVGTTTSTNFPVNKTNAYQTEPEPGSVGTSHVFVTELLYDGTQLPYSSYLSGNNTDVASGMTLDAAGNVYVTGTTMSTDTGNPSTGIQFPASTLPEGLAFQTISNAEKQFFVTKVSTNAPGVGSIAYSTYFGGATSDTTPPVAVGGGIAVDTNGNVYFSGTTNFLYTGCSSCSTTDFPILNAYQACLGQAPLTNPTNPPTCSTTTTTTDPDAFVARLNPNGGQGAQLIWSTYLGGSNTDSSTGVALDSGAANVYVVGTTNSTDIGKSVSTLSTAGSYQPCLDGPNLPASNCPTTFNTTPPPSDAFVARLSNPARSTTNVPVNVALNYFSYLGGSDNDAGAAITVDSNSGALVTGWTQSPDFPVLPNPNSIQTSLNGPQDAFVARLNTAAVSGQSTSGSWANYYGGSGTDSGTSITLDVNQDTYIAGDTNSTDLHVAKPLQATNNGGYDAFVTQLGTAVSLSISGTLTLGTNQTFISAGNQATFTYIITNNGPDLATNITVTDSLSQLVTGVPLTFVSASISSGTCGGVTTNAFVSCSLPSLQSGSTATVTIVVTPTPNINGSSPESFNGGTVQVTGLGNIVYAQTSVPAQMSDFSMTVSPRNQSVPAAGQTASYQVQLTPEPLYTGTIALSCSNLPTGATCGFSPSSPTLQSASGVTAVLSISTTARPVVTPAASLLTRHDYAFWLMLPGLTLLGVGVGGGRRRRIFGMLMLCALFALLLWLPACSKSTTQAPVSGTPSGNWTVTVTAASGSDSKSQTVTLYVP